MSDYEVKIIPVDPFFSVSEREAQKVVRLLERKVKAGWVELNMRKRVEFVHCGQNLERISCPHCHALLDFDWWGEAMNANYQRDSGFTDLSVKLPCCGNNSTLNDLVYDFPCGFSTVEFVIVNPEDTLSDRLISKVQSILGIDVRIIHAHV